MPPHRRIIILALCTGITAGLASSLNIEWMRYLMVVLIGVVGALYWQINEVREEAAKHIVRIVSHHLNNSLTVTLNRQYLDPSTREQIVDEELLRCLWVTQTILPALKFGLPQLLNAARNIDPNEWARPDIEKWRREQRPTVH